jgi:YidC/Oxa1 family membrane protein insertase
MLFYKIFHNPGVAIMGVSVAVTLLCLPLYIVAEKWQQTEREIQKYLAPMMNNIKAVFKGDERFMILQEFYRQNHYHPIYALRSSMGILIQIPFFIAAYSYLSHLEVLKGVSFLFIPDMGAPDMFARLGGITINILPILMTVINIISGILYTKGFSAKDKVQLFVMAGVFLLLLYNSPAGLVIYWTMNNILSLVKNIFYKLKNPLKVIYFCICVIAAALIFYTVFISTGAQKKRILLGSVLSLVFFIPLYIRFINYALNNSLSVLSRNKKLVSVLYFSSSIAITLLIGLCIPTMVISSSPEEFSFIDNYKSPWIFVFNSFFQAAGLFFLWPGVIYLLFKEKVRIILTFLLSLTALFMIINTFVFQGNYGNISNTFLFDSPGVLTISKYVNLLNISIFIALTVSLFFIFKFKKTVIIHSFLIISVCFLTVFSLYNIILIHSGYKRASAFDRTSDGSIHKIAPLFSLSKTKPNVIVIMPDAGVSSFLDPIFKEHPRLKEQFDGFVYYPNTVSFSSHTLMGIPPVWGGYEYTPFEMNRDESRTLQDKHNEALMVLPVLFKKSGFDVTVTDQSWANYSWIPDLSIYKSTGINAVNTIKKYTNNWFMENNTGKDNITSAKIMRNTLWFSILKVSPPFLRSFIYDDSVYWSPENIGDSIVNFINSYAVLDYLPELTSYDSDVPEAAFITNELTHESVFLQYPEYRPAAIVTEKGNGKYSAHKAYHANTAFYLKFGEYLDELKKNNVYDNTRIIIVSDHGSGINSGLFDGLTPSDERPEMWNPILLVKDFNSQGLLKTDMNFMTNGDIPSLAAENIISNPVNPFTGLPITTEAKKNGVTITDCHIFMSYQHPKNKFNISDNEWVKVHDNIFKSSNWSEAKK